MSQICPSSSHQLVAASIAFQRARRKFPKNYGLCGNSEVTSKIVKENVTINENSKDQENAVSTLTKNISAKRGGICATAIWSDERGENMSMKENSLRTSIICSCCRKRNEAAKANEPINYMKQRDEWNAGDALDTVPSREYNGLAISNAKRGDPKLEQQGSYNEGRLKPSEMEAKDFTRRHTLCSFSQRRRPEGTSSKLNSVNLLHGRNHEKACGVNHCSSLNERNRNTNDHNSEYGKNVCKLNYRDAKTKLKSSVAQRDTPSFGTSCFTPHSDTHSRKHSNLDLLRSQRDYHSCQKDCRSHYQVHHHHLCCDEECNNCCMKEEPCRTSNSCCRSNSSDEQGQFCAKSCDSMRDRNCYSKDSEKVPSVQEQNDEEYDDSVGAISHKDSLCILVEKYKTSKKNEHKEHESSDERIGDECGNSLISEISYRANATENINNIDQREKSFEKNIRRWENRGAIGKTCRHGCGQIFREADGDQLKNLKSRLIKSGTCYSPKGTPWRHTF